MILNREDDWSMANGRCGRKMITFGLSPAPRGTDYGWQDGWIIPSEKPGLGITLNRDVIEAHSPYTDKRLHLSMWETPHDFKVQSDTSWKEPPAKA